MPIGLLVLALLIGLPLLEIVVFIEVGSEIGALWTILLTIATAIAGSLMLRIQGLGLLTRMRREMEAGAAPGRDLVEGALMVTASLLLLVPGFLTDAAGLLLFVPPVRRAIAGLVIRNARVTVVRAQARGRRGPDVVDLDAEDWTATDPGAPAGRDAKGSPWIQDAGRRDGTPPRD